MSLAGAVYKDIGNDLVGAADCYEQIVQAECAPLEAYLNLSVLYWQCTDYGFNTGHNLSMDFVHKAGQRYSMLLQAADRCYPYHPEVQFWMLYCDHVTLGDPSFVEDCKKLAAAGGELLVPYFYLYSAYNGQEYQEQASLLLDECLKQPTVKNKYIISVIQGAASRAERKTRKESATESRG